MRRAGWLAAASLLAVVCLPAGAAEVLAPWRDKPVVLGFRAEHVRSAANVPRPGTLRFRVEVTEFLGAETLLHGAAGGTAMTCRWTAGAPPDVGSELPVQIDLSAASFFDPASGRAIR